MTTEDLIARARRARTHGVQTASERDQLIDDLVFALVDAQADALQWKISRLTPCSCNAQRARAEKAENEVKQLWQRLELHHNLTRPDFEHTATTMRTPIPSIRHTWCGDELHAGDLGTCTRTKGHNGWHSNRRASWKRTGDRP